MSCSIPSTRASTAYIIQDMMSVMMLYKGYDGNMVEYMDDPAKAAAIVEEVRDFLIKPTRTMVRKYYESGAEVQQMFINQDIVLAHAWSGPISKLIMDGFPVAHDHPEGRLLRLRLHPERRQQRRPTRTTPTSCSTRFSLRRKSAPR